MRHHIALAASLLAAALVGALGALAWSGPRSDTWPFAATVDDLIGWSSTQSTATVVGQVLVVVTVALAVGLRMPTRIAPWVCAALLVVVLAFTKVAIPEAASLAVFTALHILKSCVAGVLVGLVLHATRRSAAGWVALATGVLGGTLLASVGTTAASAAFVATRLDSTSVFGEPAWWLIGSAFAACIVAAVLHRPAADPDDDPTARELVRLTVYAVIVAVVCRVGVEIVGTGEYALWKAIVVLIVALVVVDRVAARWESADARTVLVAILVTAAAVAMWNVGARTLLDSRLLTVVGVGGLVLGAVLAWWLPLGRITSWLAALALTALPMGAALVSVDEVSAAALGVVAALVPIALTAVTADPHATVRPLAAALPGLAILVAAAAPVPAQTLDPEWLNQLSIGSDQPTGDAYTGSPSVIGDLDTVMAEYTSTDLTSAYLLLGVAALCTLRIVWLSRRTDALEPDAEPPAPHA
ncbi:hypothetical protein [Rhodococcus sp. SORGH_AS_0303]|uniref:hypothetical protein n=1 Tax=Rhodococcus sp. SORGH_AS_0303 TaxID=3041753 RepID=UPI002781FD80|nr:hypothetical protein [Rhodococcus sp. SORGH_AS_0303]MDQ1199973.1 MFS family permease [Rhodococcus sp. SORGH_AS_0303]